MVACLSLHWSVASHFSHFCLGMHRNQNLVLTHIFRLFSIFFFNFVFLIFLLSFSYYLFAAEIDLLLGLLPVQKFRRKDQFYYGVAKCRPKKFSSKFSTQIFKLFCAYLTLQFAGVITQFWVALERSYPLAILQYR